MSGALVLAVGNTCGFTEAMSPCKVDFEALDVVNHRNYYAYKLCPPSRTVLGYTATVTVKGLSVFFVFFYFGELLF